jgi:hypothetical protein
VDFDSLLTQLSERIAAESGVSNTPDAVANIKSRLRWEPRPDRNPPAVVIMRRGKKVAGVSNVVAVISSTGKYADLYPSWAKALAELQEKKFANGVSRTSHDDLSTGALPS